MSIGSGDIKIIVDIQNQQKLDQLTESIRKQQTAIRDLNSAFQAGTISEQQFLQQSAPLASSIASATKEAKGLQGALGGNFGRNGAMGLMMLSQAIDDAQYGFRSIVNNIPMLTASVAQGLGMSTESAYKLGGALGIAAVAINTLITNWEDAKGAFGDTAAFQAAEAAIDGIRDAMMGVIAAVPSGGMIGGRELQRGMGLEAHIREQRKEEDDRAANARAAVKGLKSRAERERAGDFHEAVAEHNAGDPERLRREMIGRSLAAQPAAERDKLRRAIQDQEQGIGPLNAGERKIFAKAKKITDSIDRGIADGLAGKGGKGEFGADIEKRMEDIQDKRKKKEADRLSEQSTAAMLAEGRQADSEKQRVRRIEHREEMFKLQDRRDSLNDKAQSVRAEMAASKPFKGSYFDYATSHGDASMENKKLEKLDQVRKAIDQVNGTIKAKQREFARAGD